MFRFIVMFSPACAQMSKIARGDFYLMVKKFAKSGPEFLGSAIGNSVYHARGPAGAYTQPTKQHGVDMIVQTPTADDLPEIRALLRQSFPGEEESVLVERLHEEGDAEIALIAKHEGNICGYVVFSKMSAPFRALGLGPVAVREDWRRRGIAAKLIHEGLLKAGEMEFDGVFVLGEPNYYQRFGFRPDHAASFESEFAGPYLMAVSLKPDGLPAQSGKVEYAPAFAMFQ